MFLIVYYGIDHKVGVVGVLCPQAKKSEVFALADMVQFWSNKTNVRLKKSSAVFSVVNDEKNNFHDFSFVECLFCLIRRGQYLTAL